MKMNEYILAGEIIFFSANWFVSMIVCSMALHGSKIPSGLASCGICLLLLDLAFMTIYSIEMIKVGGFINLLKEYKKKNQATQMDINPQVLLSNYIAPIVIPTQRPLTSSRPPTPPSNNLNGHISCQTTLHFDTPNTSSNTSPIQIDHNISPISPIQNISQTPCNSPSTTFEMI